MRPFDRKVRANSAAIFLSRIVDVLAGLASTILTARYLGVSLFGEFAFVTALVGFLVSATYFGLERIAIRELARNRDEAGESLGAILIVRWALSVLSIAAIGVFIAFSFGTPHIVYATVIASVSELVWASGSVFMGTFRAFERMEFETLTTFLFRIANLAFIAIVILLDLGFLALFAAIAASNIVRTVSVMYISNTKFVRPVMRLDYAKCKFYIKEAYTLGLVVIFAVGSLKAGHMAIKYFRDAADVALYQAPQAIVMQMQILPVSISIAFFPALSKMGAGGAGRVGDLCARAMKYLFLAGLVISVATFFLSGWIIWLIFGAGFEGASKVLSLLAWTQVPLFLSTLMEFALISIDRQADVVKAWAVAFTLNAVMTIALVPAWGALGAALAMLASFTLLSAILYHFLARRAGLFPYAAKRPGLGAAG